MNIIQHLNIAIQNENEGEIDALMYISKIEAKKSRINFDKVIKNIQDYYQKKYNNVFSPAIISLYEYLGKNQELFYDINELNIDMKFNIITDIIMDRIKDIDNSSCSYKYKHLSISLLTKYLQILSPFYSVKKPKQIVKKYMYKKIFLSIILISTLFIPLLAYLIKKYYFSCFRKNAYYYMIGLAIISFLKNLPICNFWFYKMIKTNNIKKYFTLLIFSIIVLGSLGTNCVKDIINIDNITNETIAFSDINPSGIWEEVKIGKTKDGKSFFIPSDYNCTTSKQYNIEYGINSHIVTNIINN